MLERVSSFNLSMSSATCSSVGGAVILSRAPLADASGRCFRVIERVFISFLPLVFFQTSRFVGHGMLFVVENECCRL